MSNERDYPRTSEPQSENETKVVPVIEEELVQDTRTVKTGSVRVRKQIDKLLKHVEMPLVRDAVDVSRVPINRVVTAIPQTREEGDTLIIPVVEEEIIVRKKLVLKEEIHVKRRRVTEHVGKDVTLQRERAIVERMDAEGRVIASSGPKSEQPSSTARPSRRRSLLD